TLTLTWSLTAPWTLTPPLSLTSTSLPAGQRQRQRWGRRPRRRQRPRQRQGSTSTSTRNRRGVYHPARLRTSGQSGSQQFWPGSLRPTLRRGFTPESTHELTRP